MKGYDRFAKQKSEALYLLKETSRGAAPKTRREAKRAFAKACRARDQKVISMEMLEAEELARIAENERLAIEAEIEFLTREIEYHNAILEQCGLSLQDAINRLKNLGGE